MLISKASRLKPVTVVAHIYEYTTQVRLTILGFPAVLGLLHSPLPRRTIPAAGASIRLDPIFNPTFASTSGCPARSQFDLPSWKALDINSSVGRACGGFVTLKGKGKYRWKPLNPLGPSPVQRRKRKRPPFVVVLDNPLTPRTLNINVCQPRKPLLCRIRLLAHQSHIIVLKIGVWLHHRASRGFQRVPVR